jgi:hypothetical protein
MFDPDQFCDLVHDAVLVALCAPKFGGLNGGLWFAVILRPKFLADGVKIRAKIDHVVSV